MANKIKKAVDRAAFENSLDGFGVLGVVFQAMFYQMYDGVDPNNYRVVVNYKGAETKEIFDTIIYPDVFDE